MLLVYPPSLHFAVAFVACLRAGLVAVPVYPPDPRKLKKDVQVRWEFFFFSFLLSFLLSRSFVRSLVAALFFSRFVCPLRG